MKNIRAMKINGEQFLGSVLELEIVFDEAPSAVTITIKDPYQVTVVHDATMTQVGTTQVYKYTYQNVDGNNDGEYLAVISATFGSNTLKYSFNFEMEDPDPTESA